MPKTNADYVREHRARKKAAENKTKKAAISSTERVRNFRARQKALKVISATENVESAACYISYIQDAGNNSNDQQRNVEPDLPYTQFYRDKIAHENFRKKFYNNSFGHACCVCDRLWFKNDLKEPAAEHEEILNRIIDVNVSDNKLICNTCIQALNRNTIPLMSTYNGFKYQTMPTFLPQLDLLSERLISPQIPFMQIRRLRHVHGQYGIYGQIINVPISVNNMVRLLPRNIDDDHCINVHIKRKKIHRTSYVMGLVNKRTIRAWLQYLVQTPLYILYDIKVDESFFNTDDDVSNFQQDEISENIPIEESLIAQQQTLLWNADDYLRTASGEHNLSQSILFDEHAEELSFPSIYLGHFRTFRDGIIATPFAIATSELRRSDRRAVTPYHLLYVAIKIMRIRVRDSLTIAFKHIGMNTKITRQQIESEDYINNCIESNLAFLRSIPNSTWYWSERKRDLFAMIRQLGKPTMFLNLSANEIGWNTLLRTLYKLKNNGADISEKEAEQLNYIQKTTLVNEDAVTCAIYFNKLVNILMNILQSKKNSPFGIYNVLNYFKKIKFQHRGSPHAHILLWLNNAPKDALSTGKQDAINMIDQLISVSSAEASGNIKLQTHKHTFTCFKMNRTNQPQKCRFDAPFMPCKYTTILTPMPKEHPGFANYAERYKMLRINLEDNDYLNIDTFYNRNNITCDEDYFQVLRAGITRPRVFLKRLPTEKWHNPFNPFVFNILKSNTDFQFIIEEYSCAAYIVEYVNKTNRGISNLQRQFREIMDENPEFDIVEMIRKMSVNMLNTVEFTSQEAAWYLLREPMSKCSAAVVYISTVWPVERHRIKKTQKQLEEIHADENSTDIWKENWFDKYEQRPEDMELITLAQFVANYSINLKGTYIRRKEQRIIRYRNYDMASGINEYKREMVTLHIPYRNEETEILAEMKFIDIYEKNEDVILQRRKEFESDLDINKIIEICRRLCHENGLQDDNDDEARDAVGRFLKANPFQTL